MQKSDRDAGDENVGEDVYTVDDVLVDVVEVDTNARVDDNPVDARDNRCSGKPDSLQHPDHLEDRRHVETRGTDPLPVDIDVVTHHAHRL